MRASLAIFLSVLFVACTTTGDSTPRAATSPELGQGSDKAQAMSHFLASVIHERMGNFAEAIKELRQAVDLSPKSEVMRLKLLGAYIQTQDYENAVLMVQGAIEVDPDNVRLHIGLGRVYFELGEMDSAVESFERAIELEPESTRAYEFLVRIEEASNDLVGAVDVYERLLEISPESGFLRYRLGRGLWEIDDLEGARASLEEALRLDPDLSHAEYLLGSIYLRDEKYEEAIELFEHFLVDNPRTASARVSIASALSRLGRFSEAIGVLTDLVESTDMEPEHHIERMYLYLRSGLIEDSSLAIVPSRVPILGTLLKALIRKQVGEPYREMVIGLDAIEGDLDTECNLYLSDMFVLFGVEESGDFFLGLLGDLREEGLTSRVIETIAGRTFMSMDRDEEAEAAFSLVLERYGPDKWVHYYLATVYENLDRSRDTEKHLRACLALDPEDADVMNFLGYVFAENNMKLEEAEDLLERALKKDPDNGFYLDSLGWIYYQMGDADKAVDLIKRAVRLMRSDDAILRDHLGDAYLLQGDIEKAVPEWRRAVRLDPKLEGVSEKIEKYRKRLGE